MVAGPSEVSVVADKSADPDLVAADLIAQAEHDVNAQSILITDNKNLIKSVNLSLKKQLLKLPKKKIASQSLKNFGLAIMAKNKKKIIEIINAIAPEHLELCTNYNNKIIKGVKNVGSILLENFHQRLWETI
jgi:histidinol dehydrogenase